MEGGGYGKVLFRHLIGVGGAGGVEHGTSSSVKQEWTHKTAAFGAIRSRINRQVQNVFFLLILFSVSEGITQN